MKKLLSLILAIMIGATFVACGKDEVKEQKVDENETIVDEVETDDEENAEADEKEDDKHSDKDEEEEKTEKPETEKPSEKPSSSTDEKKPETNKPVEKPAQKPTEKPAEKPAETPSTSNTLGNRLLAEFKSNAKAGKSSEDIVSALSAKISAFGTIVPNPVVPGDYLPGFDNSEIKGFKSGIAFMPMIGSTPFVGYVFELDGNVSASAFISTLKNNANLRWLICAEAEEMVAGSEGNRVFFVMCPKSIGE